MKKLGVIFIVIILFGFVSFVSAQQLPFVNPETGDPQVLGVDINNLPKTPEEAVNTTGAYLAKEWGKLLANSSFFKPFYSLYIKNQKLVDGVSKSTIGMAPSMSWLYLIAFIGWFSLVQLAFSLFSLIPEGKSERLYFYEKLILTLIAAIIISYTHLASILARLSLKLLNIINTWWGQLLGALIIIIIFVLIATYSQTLIKMAEFFNRKRKLERALKDAKEAKEMAKEAKEKESPFDEAMAELGNDPDLNK